MSFGNVDLQTTCFKVNEQTMATSTSRMGCHFAMVTGTAATDTLWDSGTSENEIKGQHDEHVPRLNFSLWYGGESLVVCQCQTGMHTCMLDLSLIIFPIVNVKGKARLTKAQVLTKVLQYFCYHFHSLRKWSKGGLNNAFIDILMPFQGMMYI